MRKNIISIINGVFCAGIVLLGSCTKMDHFYKDFVIERTYIGMPDSIWIEPGDQRVLIGWRTPKDGQAKDMVVRWGNTDSVIFAIDADEDRQSIIIDNLEERDYTFIAYTSDRMGHRSLLMELNTEVFGDNYRASIRDRDLSHAVVFPVDSIAFIWNSLGQLETLFGTQIEFTNKSGTKQQVFSSVSEAVSMIQDVDPDQPISVRTVYRPHENALDNFYMDPVEIDLVETKRNTLTLSSATYQNADFIDFNLARVFLEKDLPAPTGYNIDLCYALGNSLRGNFLTIDGNGFAGFASAWQDVISNWPIRNVATIKRQTTDGARAVYDSLDETDRDQMKAAFDEATASALQRVYPLNTGDIVFLYSADRDLYVAMKVLKGAPTTAGVYGEMEIEFKISRP